MFIINGEMLSSVPWRLKQEDPEMKAILSYIESVFKKKKVLRRVMTHVQESTVASLKSGLFSLLPGVDIVSCRQNQ